MSLLNSACMPLEVLVDNLDARAQIIKKADGDINDARLNELALEFAQVEANVDSLLI